MSLIKYRIVIISRNENDKLYIDAVGSLFDDETHPLSIIEKYGKQFISNYDPGVFEHKKYCDGFEIFKDKKLIVSCVLYNVKYMDIDPIKTRSLHVEVDIIYRGLNILGLGNNIFIIRTTSNNYITTKNNIDEALMFIDSYRFSESDNL